MHKRDAIKKAFKNFPDTYVDLPIEDIIWDNFLTPLSFKYSELSSKLKAKFSFKINLFPQKA